MSSLSKISWPYSSKMTIGILAMLVLFMPVSNDLYIPSLQQITTTFHSTQAEAHITLTAFMVFTGLGQLLVGPMSDHMGRRKTVIICLFFFMAGTMTGALASKLNHVILARALEALGSAGIMASGFTIMRDLYDQPRDIASKYSLLSACICLSPIAAPIFGGLLAQTFGWRQHFILLTLIAFLVLCLMSWALYETRPITTSKQDQNPTTCKGWLNAYIRPLARDDFRHYMILGAISLATFYVFFASSPVILIKLLHQPEASFGYCFGFIGIMLFIGSSVSSPLNKRFGIDKTIWIGALTLCLGSLMMLITQYLLPLSIYTLLGPMIVIALGSSMMKGACLGGAMLPFKYQAGTAYATYGCCQFLTSACVGWIVMHWSLTSGRPIGMAMAILGITAFTLQHRYLTSDQDREHQETMTA